MVVEIPLTKGYVALVDDEDVSLVTGRSWHSSCHKRKDGSFIAYARTNVPRAEQPPSGSLTMHRLILGAMPGQAIDHINGDGLDNRRGNIRLATNRHNQFNQKSTYGKSKYKGVSPYEGKWRATIFVDGRKRWLGTFVEEWEAALAYDRAALLHRGAFAGTNFPPGLIERLGWLSPEVREQVREALEIGRRHAVYANHGREDDPMIEKIDAALAALEVT